MRGISGILLLILSPYVSVFGQNNLIRTNDRISGTSQLQLTPENLSKLATRTSDLIHKKKSVRKEYRPGISEKFYTFNFEEDKYESVNATLFIMESGINIWVQDSETANGHITDIVLENIKDNLLNNTPDASIDPQKGIIQIVNQTFGQPPNYDRDGITDFLIVDIKDGWSEGEGFIAGYFNPIDQYANGEFVSGVPISGSNERDMLYIDSYPGIFHIESYRYEDVMSTVSHEYQHLIQYNYDRGEELFVNEGLSELSSFLCGYGLRDPSLYFFNSDLSIIAWNSEISEALKHYAKTTLWTYYLYEKYGLNLIRAIAQNRLSGVPGIQAAISDLQIHTDFEDILADFFIAFTLNDITLDPLYGFLHSGLKGLRAVPQIQIYDYPKEVARSQLPFSLNLLHIENGTSLQIFIKNNISDAQVILYKFGRTAENFMVTISDPQYSASDFGLSWQRGHLMSINTSANQGLLSVEFNSRQQYYVSSNNFNVSEPDININFGENTIANRFTLPYDSCILRSVKLYQSNLSGQGKLYIFKESIDANPTPDYKIEQIDGLLSQGWNEILIPDQNFLRNMGQSFDLGFEFNTQGIAGYTNQKINTISSFMKTTNSVNFLPLSRFKVDDSDLNGTWMMNITWYAPLKYNPASEKKLPASYVINQLGPSPFPTPGNSVLTILYTISRPGNLNISIFDINGRLVDEVYNGYEIGPTGGQVWQGRNKHGKLVASGSYYLRFNFEGVVEHRKILVLR